MPLVRMIGGGDFFLTSKPWTRAQPNLPNIFDLLLNQPYIHSVGLHAGEYISHNLDAFRGVGTKENNIAARHCWAFGLPDGVINLPWLTVEPRRQARVIFNRTARYRNPLFPWQSIVDKYRDVAAFVGTLAEYWNFTAQFGYVRRLKTGTLYDVARAIAGAELFIGNQSAPCAIAEGLKKPLIQETFLGMSNCRFERESAQYVTDGTIDLWEP